MFNKMQIILLIIIIILLINAIYDLFYYIKILNCKKVNSSKIKSDIVVSLTTIPNRINLSKNCLLSILNGSVSPKEIIFNIPYKSSKGKDYIIPDWLQKMSNDYPILKLNRCDKDFGPATKVIPTLMMFKDQPEQKIIYIDDDIIYPRNFIKNYIKDSQGIEGAITRCGYKVDFYKKNKCKDIFIYLTFLSIILFIYGSYKTLKIYGIKTYLYVIIGLLLMFIIYQKLKPKKEVDILMGFSGVMVKPKYFNISKLLKIEEYPKECFYHDDIFLSGNVRENGISAFRIKDSHENFPNIDNMINWKDNLGLTHNLDEKNRITAINCFKWN